MKPSKVGTWLGRWGWLPVLLAAPFLLFPSSKWSPALLVIPGLWLLSLLTGESLVDQSPLNLSLLLMSLPLLVSLGVTPDLTASLPKVAGMVLGLGAYFTVLHISHRKYGWWVALTFFLLLGGGVALVGLMGTSWVTTKFKALVPLAAKLPAILLRLPGASDGLQPNEVAGALLWVLPVMVCLAAVALRKGEVRKELAIPLILAALLTGGVLALTQSRSAWLALAVTFAIAPLLILPRRARLALLVGFVLVAAGAGYWIATGRVGDLLSGGTSDVLAANTGISLSELQLRQVIWTRAIMGLQDFPLTGMGMNIFRQELGRLYPWYGMDLSRDFAHAHNEFLQAGLDLGLPGLVAFASLYLVAFWMLVSLWRRLRQGVSVAPAMPGVASMPRLPGRAEASPALEKAILLGLGGADCWPICSTA